MTPQLLIVGHIVKDIQSDGWSAGGGALYAAAQASKLGVETAVVTACEDDVEPVALVPGVQWHVKRVSQAIRFENTYTNGRRSQRLLSSSTPLTLENVPAKWRSTPSALLTPVFHDVDPLLPSKLVKLGTSIAIGAQGWLRTLDGDRVAVGRVEPEPEWLHGYVVFVSEEDVAEPDAVEAWLARVGTVVLTRGRGGCTIWSAQGRRDLPPFPACERDPTGAGDVFATAYVVRFAETGDAVASARFAAAAAAVSVEGRGISSVADRVQIEARLRSAGVAG